MIKKLSPESFNELVNGNIKLDKISRYHPDFESISIGYQWIIKEFNYEEWLYTGNIVTVQVTSIFQLDLQQAHITRSSVITLNSNYKFLEIEVV
ncbi:hypothetical protein [Floridanema aerugineum]|uniref:Uncharacterized protein n=1 Tax=Floridaenema aerugineum BLCC-F46 TaxID=3153654 RepID=A0ABV4XDU5_9CYAN